MSELYAYIDESGIFQKLNNPNHQYFVISIVLTETPKQLARVFKRSLLKSVKDDNNLLNILKTNKEIKGSELPEIRKNKIYSDLCSTSVVSEVGIIVVDTLNIEEKFKKNAARAFNYLLKLYLMNYMKSNNNHPNCTKMNLFVDERNIATKSTNTLKEYLNTELVMGNAVFQEEFDVCYCDSKTQPLIQLSDYIANTTLRNFHNYSDEVESNASILKKVMTNGNYFMFSNK